MKNQFLLTSVIFSLTTLFSCKKDPKLISEELITYKFNQYYPMSVGSYWVYEYNGYSAEGVLLSTDPVAYDTIKIISETTIGQESFFVFQSNYPTMDGLFYRRDSAGYIISETGSVLLTPEAAGGELFNNRISYQASEDASVNSWSRFPDFDLVSVPAGDYTALQRTDFYEFHGLPYEGTVIDTSYYSKIGVLQRGFIFIGSGQKMRGKLIGFHLE
jgi:hypothetical protein